VGTSSGGESEGECVAGLEMSYEFGLGLAGCLDWIVRIEWNDET